MLAGLHGSRASSTPGGGLGAPVHRGWMSPSSLRFGKADDTSLGFRGGYPQPSRRWSQGVGKVVFMWGWLGVLWLGRGV